MRHSKAYVTSLGGYKTLVEGVNLIFSVEDGGFLHIDSEIEGIVHPVAVFIPGSWRECVISHAEGNA